MTKGLINVEEGEDEDHNDDHDGVGLSSINSVHSYRNYVRLQFSTVMTVSVSTTPLKLPMLKKKWIQWRSTKCKTKLQYARFEPD